MIFGLDMCIDNLKIIHKLYFDRNFSYSEREPLSSVTVNPFPLSFSHLFSLPSSSHKRKLQTMFWINYNFLELIWKMCILSHSHTYRSLLSPWISYSLHALSQHKSRMYIVACVSYHDLNHTSFSWIQTNIVFILLRFDYNCYTDFYGMSICVYQSHNVAINFQRKSHHQI